MVDPTTDRFKCDMCGNIQLRYSGTKYETEKERKTKMIKKGDEGMNITWDTYFISLAYLIAMKSKDTKTKHGSVIVGIDNEIVSTGYNSPPRGIDDNKPERQGRPEKYFWNEHSERNAIYNAARIGVSLKGCRLLIKLFFILLVKQIHYGMNIIHDLFRCFLKIIL